MHAPLVMWDASFGALQSVVALTDATAQEPWMNRAFVLRNMGADFTPVAPLVAAADGAFAADAFASDVAAALQQRLTRLYSLLFAVVVEGSATSDSAAAPQQQQQTAAAGAPHRHPSRLEMHGTRGLAPLSIPRNSKRRESDNGPN